MIYQIVSTKYDKPFIIRYVNDSSNIFGLIVPLIWLCTTKLFAKKVIKDRKKLLEKKRKRNKGLTDSAINSSQMSLSYQYQGSPMGMGGHPVTVPTNPGCKNSLDHSLEHGSLFNQSLLTDGLLPRDVDESPSITGASVHCTEKGNKGNKGNNGNENLMKMAIHSSMQSNQWVSIQVSDAASLALNKKETDAFSKLLTNSTKTSKTTGKSRNPATIELHFFHPNPSEYKRYKHALKHIHSTIHLALVKGRIYHFALFLVSVSWLYSGGGMLWLSTNIH